MQARPDASAAGGDAPPVEPVLRREIFGWCMFDFANSSYTTVIITVLFGPYFVGTVAREAGLDEARGDLLWGLAQWLAQGAVLLTAPLVGALCDLRAAKKRVLLATWLGCVAGTAGLFLVRPGDVALAFSLFVAATIFFSVGENVVAAFLPELATPRTMGRVSGLGWALGYLGGLGSLAACLPFVSGGMDAANAGSVRWAWVVVAAFFFFGALPTFIFLRERARPQPVPPGANLAAIGARRVLETLRHVRRHRQLFRFLWVFFVYACGVNVVVSFAAIFAERELKLSFGELTRFFIIMQLSASVGAALFGILHDKLSARTAVQLSLLLWLMVCAGGYATTTVGQLYVVGNIAGIAMGSSQSSARALVGSFSPAARAGEFFGFWGLFWKLAGVGPLAFGVLRQWVDTRTAILVTGVTFLAGLVGMFAVDEAEGLESAGGGALRGGSRSA